MGTKVCLVAKNLLQIYKTQALAEQAGIPTYLVIDSGCPDFFEGKPTVTALGVGPVRRDQAPFLRKLQTLKE